MKIKNTYRIVQAHLVESIIGELFATMLRNVTELNIDSLILF